jgi:Coenzyme PQQ synthesis protein D (PqqD)
VTHDETIGAMSWSLDERACAAPQVLCRDLGDEAVLLDLATETYFGLNATGTRLWKLLTGGAMIGDALATLVAEFDVSAEIVDRDMTELIDDLVQRGLLRIGNA